MPDDDARLEDARAWIDKATLDLRAGDLLLGSSDAGLLGNAAFHAQQAAEKALKAFLAWHDVPFRKTHSIEELRRACVCRRGEGVRRCAGSAAPAWPARGSELLRLVEPSKLYGIMAAGRPALFVGPEESEVARTIRREGCGEAGPDSDYDLLLVVPDVTPRHRNAGAPALPTRCCAAPALPPTFPCALGRGSTGAAPSGLPSPAPSRAKVGSSMPDDAARLEDARAVAPGEDFVLLEGSRHRTQAGVAGVAHADVELRPRLRSSTARPRSRSGCQTPVVCHGP